MSERDVQIELSGKTGRVLIDGLDVSSGITYVGVVAAANQIPMVTLHVALPRVTVAGKAEVHIPAAIEAALVRLGWTPPHV